MTTTTRAYRRPANLRTDLTVRRLGVVVMVIRDCTNDEADRIVDTITLTPGECIIRTEYLV